MTRAGAARARVARNRARRRTAGGLVVALVVGGLGYAAVASDGSTVHEADLNDAGVWVSSAQQAKFAKANVPIGQLETGVATDASAGAGLDVLQDGAVVLGLNTGTGELFPLDARTSTAGEPVAQVAAVSGAKGRFVPRPVDLRGGTLAVLDPASGKVFAQKVDPKAGTTAFPDVAVGAKPVATVGKNAALAVGVDGTVHVVSGLDGAVTTIAATPTGFAAPVVTDSGLRSTLPDLTAVGTTWVAYDAETDRVFTAATPEGLDAQATVDGNRVAALQQPGPDADTVVVESAQRATQVPLDGGASPGGVVVGEQVNRVPGATLITRPVVLGGCVHAAWAEQNQVFYGANCGRTGDEPTATLPADGEEPTRDGVAFRVNRGLVVLNDLDNGGVWDLDDKPTKIDNWDALTPPTRQDDENDKKDENLLDEAALQQPPTATPDSLQVRPGRTSKLHVLDNDTDVAGSVLAIDQRDVTEPSLDGVAASVSADGQAIDVSVPEGSENRSFEFSYKVNNGKTVSKESARVSVRIVPDSVNGAPALRQGGAKLAAQVYPVIAGKRLSVPVLADWRDPENDVLAARADVEGAVVDGQGRVTLAAPTTEGKQPVGYLVTDGRGGTTKGSVTALVISPSGDSSFVAPKTQPDAVRGVVGKPLQVEPLGNDVAGADPGEPDATLRLRSEVRPVGPLQVDTDLATGQVTVTGSAPGTFELSYSATTGAGAAPGRIRVDLVAPPKGAPPVSVPDTATLHDQAPAMVDVLANDYSPRGDVLVTASVSSSGDSSWIQPSIYQGRWVRLEATQPAPTGDQGRRGTVTYTVSDGTQRVTGQVSVLQQGAVTDSLPIVVDDTATVREGDTVSIPVLDNDTMADGIPLRLDPASVKVVSKGDAQRAFASGNVIRYVPEATGLTAERFVTIEYAAYADGMKERAQTARARVQVTPLPSAQRPNQSPVARSFTATVTAGDPLTMTVPTFGVDPDGDSVSVAGVVGQDGKAVDLTYGRVVGIGPSTIRYEAYPLAAGTEVITYEVTDRFGATSRAFVRVGVVQPGDPQPPVAVADEVFAAPGKTVTVKPLVNDLIARGDVVEVDVESLNDAATRKDWDVDEDHTVTTTVPADTTALHQLVYGISDGLFDPSRASILVRAVRDWVNPPVANDDVAAPKPGETSTLVDVLANDTDVDSDPATLKIVEVLSSSAVVENGRVRVQVLDHPYSVPYVIEDEDGARAMALVHVPTGANGQPFVVAGTVIQMDPDSTATVALGDHVRSPRGRVVSVTTADTLSASPAENLGVSMPDNRTLELTSSNGYVGPAAVMVEVTDQDAVDQKDFGTAYVSIPVQVGPKVPLLRCPDGAVTVTAGGLDRTVDIPTFCHAWLPVGMSLDDVTFDTRWETEPDADLAVDGPGNRTLTLHAGPDAKSSTGQLSVTSRGLATPSTIAVRVVGAPADGSSAEDPVPPPTLRPISVTGLKEGESRTVDVRPYLDSPLPQPECSITDDQRRVRHGPHGHRLRLHPHARRRREALAHGLRRDHGQRRPGPHRAGPRLRDDARAALGPTAGHRRGRPRRRRSGARVVAAAHLRRRFGRHPVRRPAHRRVHRADRVQRLPVHGHRPHQRRGLPVHRRRGQRHRRGRGVGGQCGRPPRPAPGAGHGGADGDPRRRHADHRLGRPRQRGQRPAQVRRAAHLLDRADQDTGRRRPHAAGRGHRARQHGRAVRAGAGVERARGRAVRAGGDDAVRRHPAGAAPAGHPGERPGPRGVLGDVDDLVGPGVAERPADDEVHPLPARRRGRLDLGRDDRPRRALGQGRHPLRRPHLRVRGDPDQRRGPGVAEDEQLDVHVQRCPLGPVGDRVDTGEQPEDPAHRHGRPAARGLLHGHPLVRWREDGHRHLRVRSRLPEGLRRRPVRHQPDEEPHDHHPDRELRRQPVEPGIRVGDSLRPDPHPDESAKHPERQHDHVVVEPARERASDHRGQRPGRRQPELRWRSHVGQLHGAGGQDVPARGPGRVGSRQVRMGWAQFAVDPQPDAGRLQRAQGPLRGRPERPGLVLLLAGMPARALRHPRLPTGLDVERGLPERQGRWLRVELAPHRQRLGHRVLVERHVPVRQRHGAGDDPPVQRVRLPLGEHTVVTSRVPTHHPIGRNPTA